MWHLRCSSLFEILMGKSTMRFSRRTNWNTEESELARAHRLRTAAGLPIADLTASNPARCGFEYSPELLAALADPRALDYDPQPRGLKPAREAVCAYYADHGVALKPEQIVLTTSTSEAYSFLFRLLCDPGDEVLVPSPSYPLFDFLADIQDVRLVPYELVYDHGWQIEFESLARAITPRSRAIMVVHPNNPTGHFTHSWELDRLNHLCSEHQLALVTDEVFLDYPIGTPAPFSFAANQGTLTFTLSGLSKICALPQIKVAWLAASGPEALVAEAMARLEVIADTYLSPNAPIQWAIPELLSTGPDIQRQLNDRVATNLAALDEELARARLVTRLAFDAGWYAVLRTPSARSDEELAILLLEEDSVLVHPGHFFDFPAAGFLVLSLITPVDDFREGICRLLRRIEVLT